MFKMHDETEVDKYIIGAIRIGFFLTIIMSFISVSIVWTILPAVILVLDYVYQINVKMNRLLKEKGLPRE